MERASLVAPIREVSRNGAIVRLQGAWTLAIAAEWAFLVGLLVYAYDAGGIAAAGALSTLRMLTPAVGAPFAASIADRFSPHRVLAIVYALRAVLVVGTGLVLVADGPPAVVFAAAAIEGLLAVLKRPTTMALLPALSRSPAELVAGNAVASTGEGLGVLVGPAIGSFLLAGAGIEIAVIAPSVALAAAAILAATIAVPHGRPPRPSGGAIRELLGGFGALRTHPASGMIIGLIGFQTFVRGLLTVLIVAASVDLLGLGREGVGWLNAAIGGGGLVGAAVATLGMGSGMLGPTFSLALAAWGLPIALIGVAPVAWFAVVLLAVVGLANAILDVSGFTLLQRTVPTALRARVFGALEGVAALTFALGSLVAAPLIAALGLAGALVAAGGLLPVVAAISAAAVRRTDHASIVPHRELALLRGVPLFAPLTLVVVERLARAMVAGRHAAGESVVSQGEAGDAYFVVGDGRATVTIDGEPVRELGPGDGFGEIALLEDRPRTASVVADGPLETFALPRDAFLEAVTGSPVSARVAAQLVADRLSAPGR
jgi:MFS family permease